LDYRDVYVLSDRNNVQNIFSSAGLMASVAESGFTVRFSWTTSVIHFTKSRTSRAATNTTMLAVSLTSTYDLSMTEGISVLALSSEFTNTFSSRASSHSGTGF